MVRDNRRWVVALLTALSSLAAVAEPLAIPGTGACEAVLRELAQVYGGETVDIPPSTGSTGGTKAVRVGRALLGRVSRPLTDEERADGLRYQSFARDAAVFVSGSGVGVKSLTSTQVRDIFSGQIRRWADVGGIDSPIRVVTRETTDAAATALRKGFPAFADAKTFDGAKLAARDSENLELLLRYKAAIGLSSRAEARLAGDRLVPLAVDGIAATPETIRSGHYPAVMEHAFVWKGKLAPQAERFIKFVQTPQGHAILAKFGLIPMNHDGG
ncbi:MAG: substrate-binding domain-containing protein [Burkholderiales bacterium]